MDHGQRIDGQLVQSGGVGALRNQTGNVPSPKSSSSSRPSTGRAALISGDERPSLCKMSAMAMKGTTSSAGLGESEQDGALFAACQTQVAACWRHPRREGCWRLLPSRDRSGSRYGRGAVAHGFSRGQAGAAQAPWPVKVARRVLGEVPNVIWMSRRSAGSREPRRSGHSTRAMPSARTSSQPSSITSSAPERR